MPDLASLLADTAARHPDRPAVVLDDRVLGYAELDAFAARAAGLLHATGVRAGTGWRSSHRTSRRCRSRTTGSCAPEPRSSR
ncbi:hypothetical protein [Kocuria sp. CNJ-770]|uniref:hypothetical protein n=1 Tax=Kocuria sp. CNJ-770 TaxID=1904964 RepID=UPI0021007D0C|nr:hypothetical protein [Kocuria sp. CNJ-770]